MPRKSTYRRCADCGRIHSNVSWSPDVLAADFDTVRRRILCRTCSEPLSDHRIGDAACYPKRPVHVERRPLDLAAAAGAAAAP